MGITVDLSPEVESRLNEAAAERGLDVAAFIRSAVEEKLHGVASRGESLRGTPSPEEVIRALDELAEMNRRLPVLPPEAFEREALYEDL